MSYFYKQIGKQLLDVFLSLLLLMLVWPVFLIIGLLIKLTSPGPILFKQKRVGKNGRVFKFYKFRTMVKEATQLKEQYRRLNEADGPVFKIKDDPRFVNGLGKLLARTGLDELPNVFNVLKGEMSWVGPRPLPVEEEAEIKPKIKQIRRSVKPGITSLWVVGGSHNLDWGQWMTLDKKYLNQLSFKTDLKIIGQTFKMCLIIFLKNLFKVEGED